MKVETFKGLKLTNEKREFYDSLGEIFQKPEIQYGSNEWLIWLLDELMKLEKKFAFYRESADWSLNNYCDGAYTHVGKITADKFKEIIDKIYDQVQGYC